MNETYLIDRLGEAKILSPLLLGTEPGDSLADFTEDDARIMTTTNPARVTEYKDDLSKIPSFELAGPRQKIYFDTSKLKVGIVTCGGICPGINDVIRGLVMTLYHGYNIAGIYGFKNGYAGLNPDLNLPIVELTPEYVKNIHTMGGTVLGTSRGAQDPSIMVDTLDRMNIRLLFTIGGDGTFRGARELYNEIKERQLNISIIGVPKTIDNDIFLVDRTFGFDTAVSHAADAIRSAYSEASSVINGIGLVKLMGRYAGFIAANAALAVRNVNLVLIPEVPFNLTGKNGLFSYMENRFSNNKSTVIVVAEGAGQDLVEKDMGKDDSGNARLFDIGIFLKEKISEHFKERHKFSLKYIDPSYMIRSRTASSSDSIFCGYLAQAAVHAGISGRTGMAVGRSHGKFTHIPLSSITKGKKNVDPEGNLWLSVLESTGQPFYLPEDPPKDLSRHSFVSTGTT